MASFPDEEDSDDDEDILILRDSYSEDDALTSFRMFHQTIPGEEVEEEVEEVEEEDVVDDISSETSELSDDERDVTIDYDELEKYMLSKQITYKNLLETLLCTLDTEQYFPCDEEIDKIGKVSCYSMGKLRRFVEASRRKNSGLVEFVEIVN
jgi:hypothetical protein